VSFSYKFSGSDIAILSADEALAALTQFVGILPIAYSEFIDVASPNYVQGVYHGFVNVADWWIFDANAGYLRFNLSES